MSRLGDLIRLERTRQGLTFKQVARKCGVSEKYLQEVESGKRIIADDQARRILKAMGMTQQTESDFTLDDIAATVDLQSAVPQLTQAVVDAGFGVRMALVVKHLEFATDRCASGDAFHRGVYEILQAAVGARCDFEIDFNDEILENFVSDNVACSACEGFPLFKDDLSVSHVPSAVGLMVGAGNVPTIERLAVEEQLPALGLLSLGQHVVFGDNLVEVEVFAVVRRPVAALCEGQQDNCK